MKLDTKSLLSYDTVGFFCQNEQCKDEITDKFNSFTDKETDIRIFEGNYEKVRIKQTIRGVGIVLSLPNYYLGSNLYSLDLTSTKEAIEKLSEFLGLSIKDAIIYKIHFGANIIMEHQVLEYLNCLISGNNLKKMIMESTVYFENVRRVLAFYDKRREQLDKKKTIPLEFLLLNILRYEIRLNRRPKQQLFINSFKGSDLYDPKIFRQMKNKWLNDYEQIKKERQFRTINLSQISNHRELMQQIQFLGVRECGGPDKLINSIEEKRSNLKLMGKYDTHTKYQITKMKNYVLNVSCANVEIEADDCIQELNKKIREIADYEK